MSPEPTPSEPVLGPCRVYRGAISDSGYGLVSFGAIRPGPRNIRRQIRLHRWVVEQVEGPLLPGQVVMHRCDNPPCFRYDHLRRASQAENMADMRAKGRQGSIPVLPGSTNPNAKLTEADVRAIRTLAGLVSTSELAARFRVNKGNIRSVVRGDSWRHVPMDATA